MIQFPVFCKRMTMRNAVILFNVLFVLSSRTVRTGYTVLCALAILSVKALPSSPLTGGSRGSVSSDCPRHDLIRM